MSGREIPAGPWDVIVIGGGITGAGVFREATRLGLRALLLEQRDFAWGTSSRSGKLVHGGLRYLRQGDLHLTWESARERQRLLQEAPGLVDDLGFLMPVYTRGQRALFAVGLTLYDLFVMRRTHRYLPPEEFLLLAPDVNRVGLLGGFCYREGHTDDARLVLRLIREGVRAGGVALNYARVVSLLRLRSGRVVGVVVRDEVTGKIFEARAHVVINAGGAWADRWRRAIGRTPRLRPLRGSHLLFPRWRFPLAWAVGFFHPVDGRPLYALPWEGATLVGTTDLDHDRDLDAEPEATPGEIDYLLTALRHTFPALALEEGDILSTFAGVRPVVSAGRAEPSREPREHVVWYEDGLLTVTGGKLTTFRVLAHDALRAVRRQLKVRVPFRRMRLLDRTPRLSGPVEPHLLRRLLGRYGRDALTMLETIPLDAFVPVAETPFLWAEMIWAAREEDVVHLDDLLLRRTRVGLLLPHGGVHLLDEVRVRVQAVLDWDDKRWAREATRYGEIWARGYASPHFKVHIEK